MNLKTIGVILVVYGVGRGIYGGLIWFPSDVAMPLLYGLGGILLWRQSLFGAWLVSLDCLMDLGPLMVNFIFLLTATDTRNPIHSTEFFSFVAFVITPAVLTVFTWIVRIRHSSVAVDALGNAQPTGSVAQAPWWSPPILREKRLVAIFLGILWSVALPGLVGLWVWFDLQRQGKPVVSLDSVSEIFFFGVIGLPSAMPGIAVAIFTGIWLGRPPNRPEVNDPTPLVSTIGGVLGYSIGTIWIFHALWQDAGGAIMMMLFGVFFIWGYQIFGMVIGTLMGFVLGLFLRRVAFTNR